MSRKGLPAGLNFAGFAPGIFLLRVCEKSRELDIIRMASRRLRRWAMKPTAKKLWNENAPVEAVPALPDEGAFR